MSVTKQQIAFMLAQQDDATISGNANYTSNVSVIGSVDIAVKAGEISIVSINHDPILTPGNLGTFDDNGVTPSCIIDDQESYYYESIAKKQEIEYVSPPEIKCIILDLPFMFAGQNDGPYLAV